MAYQLRTLKRGYKKAIKEKEYDYINEIIAYHFWQIKKVRKAFEEYIKNWRNPNPWDTYLYKDLKPSEQANVDMSWMNDVLTETIVI